MATTTYKVQYMNNHNDNKSNGSGSGSGRASMYGKNKQLQGRRRRHGFTAKCASLVKQQRARIYILRRCATTLLCWYIIQHDD